MLQLGRVSKGSWLSQGLATWPLYVSPSEESNRVAARVQDLPSVHPGVKWGINAVGNRVKGGNELRPTCMEAVTMLRHRLRRRFILCP